LNYFDVFAGAGGFSLGMPKHYKCVGLSEIDKYCNAVLKHNFPDYINYGDISNIKWEDTPDFDLLIGWFALPWTVTCW
jgi:DNA (cytosine-5)-methyltransferase 1